MAIETKIIYTDKDKYIIRVIEKQRVSIVNRVNNIFIFDNIYVVKAKDAEELQKKIEARLEEIRNEKIFIENAYSQDTLQKINDIKNYIRKANIRITDIQKSEIMDVLNV